MTCEFSLISYLIWGAVDLIFCGMQQVQDTQNIQTSSPHTVELCQLHYIPWKQGKKQDWSLNQLWTSCK